MKNRLGLLAAIVLISTTMMGCATKYFTPPVSEGAGFEKEKSYVYGRFAVGGIHPFDVALNGYDSIGLKFNCDSGNSFVVGLLAKNQDQIIEVAPGRCSLDSLLFTNGSHGRTPVEKPFLKPTLKSVDLEPGVAYYIGDFAARLAAEYGMYVTFYEMALTDHHDNFEATTTVLSAKRPNFASLPKKNAMSADSTQ
jgi:hypothetical protein